MKAVTYNKYGPPDVLEIKNVKKPSPKDNEVLVEVHATTMNRTDTGYRSAEYFVSRFFTGLVNPKTELSGSEFAGKVVKVGKNVKRFKVGDKVFGFNDTYFGAHAEYRVELAEGPIAKIPKGFSYREAAPAGEGATYALNDIKAVKLKRGQHVLIYGATGSIGSASVQICKHFGVNITAVCNTKNVKLVKSLGADKVVSYEKDDFTADKTKYDFVFDAVGKLKYSEVKHMLKPTGKFASAGGAVIFTALWHAITRQRKAVFFIPKINKEYIEFIAKLMENKEYKPVIDRTYPLERAVEAAKYAETGQKTGNIVLTVRHSD